MKELEEQEEHVSHMVEGLVNDYSSLFTEWVQSFLLTINFSFFLKKQTGQFKKEDGKDIFHFKSWLLIFKHFFSMCLYDQIYYL